MAKKFFYFLMICLYIIGVIGGIGYTIYGGAYPCAVGVLALGWMSWPKEKEYYNLLME